MPSIVISMSSRKPIYENFDVIAIMGPSASGKTTLVKKLLRAYPSKFVSPIGWTTRDRRKGEVDGHDYNFVSLTTFEAMKNAGLFADTVTVQGHYYGITKSDFLRCMGEVSYNDKKCLMVLTYDGVEQFREAYPRLNMFALTIDPDVFTLAARLDALDAPKDDARRKRVEEWESEKYLYYDISDAVFEVCGTEDDGAKLEDLVLSLCDIK